MKFNELDFGELNTLAGRAEYLLKVGVRAKLNIVDLVPVMQACIGEGNVCLPVTASTEAEAIEKGTEWLQERATV